MKLLRGLLALSLAILAPFAAHSQAIGPSVSITGRYVWSTQSLVAAPSAQATSLTQFSNADQIFQRDSFTGGGQGKGQSAIPVTMAISSVGTVNACLSSASGTHTCNLQAEWQAGTASGTGSQTITLFGVDAGLRWGYLSVHDATGWKDGTTRIGIGDLSAIAGQSLGVDMLVHRTGDSSLAALGITPSAYTRVFATAIGGGGVCGDYNVSAASITWNIPSDTATLPCWGSAGVATYLNQLVAYYGVNQGIIGHTVDGAAALSFMQGQTYYTQWAAVVAAAGGKYRFDTWFQGHQEAKANVPAAQVARDQGLRISYFDALNGLATSCPTCVTHLLASVPNIHDPTTYGPVRNINAVRLGQKTYAAAHSSNTVYADSEAVAESDGIHETQAGAIVIANDWTAALTGQPVGPKILSATRSGQTITVTMDQATTVTGSWWLRFTAYLSGSTLTIYPIDNGSQIDGTTLTLHIANGNDPGDGQVLGLWLGMPNDGDANTSNPSGIMLRSATGRTFSPNTAETTVAAPTPGGATNAPATGYAASASYMDLTASASPTYAASAATPFGSALTAGWTYTTSATVASLMPISIEAIITVPNASGGNAIIAGYRTSGATLLFSNLRKITFSGPGFSVAGATALTVGDTWYVCGVSDDNGTRLIIAKWNGSGWNTATKDATTSTVGSTRWAFTTAQRFFIGDNATAGGTTTNFFNGGGGGAIAHVAVWAKSLYLSTDSTFTPPSTARAGTETDLIALFKFASGSETKDSVRAQ